MPVILAYMIKIFHSDCYFFTKPYGMTIYSNRLFETIRFNGHTIGFGWKIRKLAFLIHVWQ